MNNKPRVTIIGKGKVGQSIAQLLLRSAYEITVFDRDIDEQLDFLAQAELVLLTVNDDDIEGLCEKLSRHFAKGSTIAHCSGSLGSDVLSSAKQNGCFIASAHPLNTFPNLPSSLQTFASTKHGTFLYSEGDAQALELLQPVFQSIGFNTVVLESAAKPAYHAACVFACNYLTVLMDLSLQSAEAASLDRDKFWRAIQPLLASTLHNINVHGTVHALSGPIARGDVQTVTSHLASLSKTENNLDQAYTLLGKHALRLAAQGGEIDSDKYAALVEILNR
ncbi:MAG: putative short-subunit dehydrogenase-like oxidoreductase (DUF2520 family) [Cryomorphaceae bacterium]|jgi:predicted short-subunit dehydrogenase-like oxidoreductase (DUF2520 family)